MENLNSVMLNIADVEKTTFKMKGFKYFNYMHNYNSISLFVLLIMIKCPGSISSTFYKQLLRAQTPKAQKN
jgi:hypothetical protein